MVVNPGTSTWLTSALVGLAFHAFTQWVEIDLVIPQTFGVLLASLFAVFYVDVQVYGSPVSDAASTLATAAVGFLASLIVSTLLHRVFFHRLRRFPGPFLARISKFYGFFYLARNLQYHFEIEKLHEKYGDVVRTGPRELSVARISPLYKIVACCKHNFYAMADHKQKHQGMPSTLDQEDHKKRRRAWDLSLTMQQVAKYDPAMQSIVTLFLERLGEQRGKPVNATEWMSWLSYDIMGVVGFGKDFGNLRSGTEHAAVRGLRDQMIAFGAFKHVPWLANVLGHIPGGQGAMGLFKEYCQTLVIDKRTSLDAKALEAPNDIMTWLIKAFVEKRPWAAHSLLALDDDSRSLVMGGADTTSGTMTNILSYLALYPSYQKKLQSALATVYPGGPSTFSPDLMDQVPLLEGIINETLRLHPPVPSGQPRVTPPEGLHVPAGKSEEGDLFIPGDTVVLMPQWLIHRDERYFERAKEFVPERWIAGAPEAGMIRERNAFFPFQLGAHLCVGKQLAMWEMKSVLARLVMSFDIALAPGEDALRFHSKALDTWTLTLPGLMLEFRAR